MQEQEWAQESKQLGNTGFPGQPEIPVAYYLLHDKVNKNSVLA